MMVCLLGLLRTERLANDMSAVTRVMDILEHRGGTLFDPGWGNRGVMTGVAAPNLTCPQTCVSGSRRALSASCRSPADRRSGMREPDGRLKPLAHAASCSPYFISFERRPDQDDGSHGGDHVVGRDVLHLHQDKVPISSRKLLQTTSRA